MGVPVRPGKTPNPGYGVFPGISKGAWLAERLSQIALASFAEEAKELLWRGWQTFFHSQYQIEVGSRGEIIRLQLQRRLKALDGRGQLTLPRQRDAEVEIRARIFR